MLDMRMLWWGGVLALLLGAGAAGAANDLKRYEVDVGADAYDIQTALMDADSLRLWMPYVKESRQVSTREDGSRVAYVKLKLPVGDPRDCVQWVVDEKKVSEDGKGEYVQRWSTVSGEVPERKGVVRIKHNEGTWRVIPMGEGKAHIVYEFSMDIGGWLSGWVTDSRQKDGVMDTFKALERRAQELGAERKKSKLAPVGR